MYKSNINLNFYKTFYEVAKYGSISETAKQTFSSQPAISKTIKKLEEELNTNLFYRTLNGVELTEKGKELLFFVEQSYNNLVIAERRMIETNDLKRGKLSIGMPSNIGSFFLFDKIIEFHNKYPNIEITIITGSTIKLISLLESHTVDFVIDTSPINIVNKNLSIKELDIVEYCFIASSNTKLNKIEDTNSLSEIVKQPLILPIPGTSNRNDLDKLLSENNLEIGNVLNIHTSEMIIAAVKRDLGIGYVIRDLIKNDEELGEIRILDIAEKLPNVKINLIYNKEHLTTAPLKFINDYICKI